MDRTEVIKMLEQNYEEPHILIFEDLGIIDLMSMDLKELFCYKKHYSAETYDGVFKHIYMTDERIISMIAGNGIKFKYKATGFTDLIQLLQTATGMSYIKIRKHLIISEVFSFIFNTDSNLRLLRPKMTANEVKDFKGRLYTKYMILKNTINGDE